MGGISGHIPQHPTAHNATGTLRACFFIQTEVHVTADGVGVVLALWTCDMLQHVDAETAKNLQESMESNNVLLVKIEGPVWYTVYQYLSLFTNGKRTSMTIYDGKHDVLTWIFPWILCHSPSGFPPKCQSKPRKPDSKYHILQPNLNTSPGPQHSQTCLLLTHLPGLRLTWGIQQQLMNYFYATYIFYLDFEGVKSYCHQETIVKGSTIWLWLT